MYWKYLKARVIGIFLRATGQAFKNGITLDEWTARSNIRDAWLRSNRRYARILVRSAVKQMKERQHESQEKAPS